MEKELLARMLEVTGLFRMYWTGKKRDQWQLRHLGPCPKCGIRTGLYLRRWYGRWRCPGCSRIISSSEIPEFAEVVNELLTL